MPEIFTFWSFLKIYFTNRPLKKLKPEMILFGTPEWLAPYPNMAAPATLASCLCHRGSRVVVEVLTRPKGAPAKVAPPLIPCAPPLRAPPTFSPPPKNFRPVLPPGNGWRPLPRPRRQGGWRSPPPPIEALPPPGLGWRRPHGPRRQCSWRRPPPTPKPFCLAAVAGAALPNRGARVIGAALRLTAN